MSADLEGLKITEVELEQLSGLAPHEVLTTHLYHPSSLSQRQKLVPLFLNEGLGFCLSLLVAVPAAFFIARSIGVSGSDSQTFIQFLQISVGLVLLLFLGWNIYRFQQAKPLQNLSKLLEEVEKYHTVIKAVEIIDRLTAVGNLQANLLNREGVIEALTVTRQSLICALSTERILRENQVFIEQRYELFANLENNLTALMSLDISNQANEYGRLLNEALEIGMSVHKEVRKLQNRA